MQVRQSGVVVVSVVTLAVVIALAGCAKAPRISGASATAPEPRMDMGSASGIVRVADPVSAQGWGDRSSPRDFMNVRDLLDVHFDFDRSDLKPAAARVLEANARWMRANPDHLILIEGHTDERGTNEYNMALGDRRAKVSMDYLVSHGVAASRITVVSYGEDRPMCEMKLEGCWSKNRRAHFAVKMR